MSDPDSIPASILTSSSISTLSSTPDYSISQQQRQDININVALRKINCIYVSSFIYGFLLTLNKDSSNHIMSTTFYGTLYGILYGLGGNVISGLVPRQLQATVSSFMYAMICYRFDVFNHIDSFFNTK